MASYKVIFLGLSVIGLEEETRLIGGLQKKFKLSPEKAESLLQRVPVVVKKGLSKEEAERYVRAFEEIGGRIKVEEEEESIPTLDITHDYEPEHRPEPGPRPEPKPAFIYKPEPEKKAFTKGMVTCPQCGFEQPETDECVKCGVIMSKYVQYQEMARSVEGQVREISSEEYTPWESGEGFIAAFLRTTQEVLFSPTKFFKKVAAGEGYWSPFIFAMISGIIGCGAILLWQWLFLSGMVPPQIRSVTTYSLFLVFAIILIPFWVAFSIVVGSGVIHLCVMIVGGNRKGFEATFRVISYSHSATLFYIVPLIGTFVGGIYLMILAILGVREGHEISTGKAVLAVLLPLIIVFGLGILLAIFIPLFIGSLGSYRGMRA
ncbi:MAG: YIP1 family protein [Thermodesulfobacteriota bacterium]